MRVASYRDCKAENRSRTKLPCPSRRYSGRNGSWKRARGNQSPLFSSGTSCSMVPHQEGDDFNRSLSPQTTWSSSPLYMNIQESGTRHQTEYRGRFHNRRQQNQGPVSKCGSSSGLCMCNKHQNQAPSLLFWNFGRTNPKRNVGPRLCTFG